MKKIFFPTALFIALISFAPLSSYSQFIYTVAGGGPSDPGDGGPADSAELYYPQGVAVDIAGNIYIADTYHNRIRLVTAATGIITTIVGTGTGGFSGDSGLAVNAKISGPSAVALNGAGNLYIADYGNQRIRKVNLTTDTITTIAGISTTGGYNGDNIAADSAKLNDPSGIAIDSAGDIYIADAGNGRVRRIDAVTGIITTVAGGGPSNPGDSMLATDAELFLPQGLAIGPGGILYIADGVSNRVRQVDPVTHIITTIAGYVPGGYNQDGIPAVAAELDNPYGLLLQDTTLYIADSHNERIRAVGLPSGYISTIAGSPAGLPGYNGDGQYSFNAELNNPTTLAQDTAGNIYIADEANDRIRIITPNVLGIAGITVQSGISIYPNPSASGVWNIETTEEYTGSKIEVSDVSGRIVYSSEINNTATQINTPDLASGVYVLHIFNAVNSLNSRLVK